MPNVKFHKTSRLCNHHFDDSNNVKGCNILGVFHLFKCWRLNEGSNQVGVEQPKVRKRALQDVTYTNLPASTLQILANVPLTVNQPPLKRSRVRKLLTIERSKVLQLVDLYNVAINEHGVSQPAVVIPTHQLPTVAPSLPPQSLATNTASTSFDLLVEYIEPGTPKKMVISHFDQQANEQSQNEGPA
ncbi:hypothetical protein DAPPUDRAFT_113149 [Daphnia pulex]|uniref:Uncharacterized protein n=1 Tax=Daphnia pulex TaxID=6669 RepID=E9HE85_DAPPU|nr:hypothetical protein DAPPUDRAFT_113149 [Daphnia pulex]|eukprot:EFX69974.1 hypothetical protein DAPPUDRAFT_113149 [Daphnia pulex]